MSDESNGKASSAPPSAIMVKNVAKPASTESRMDLPSGEVGLAKRLKAEKRANIREKMKNTTKT